MELVKKYGPIGAAGGLGAIVAHYLTKGRSVPVQVIAVIVGVGAGVLGGVKLNAVKL